MENTDNMLIAEQRKLFDDIKADIRSNAKDYKIAGKWVDDYCSAKGYWQRYRDGLKKFLRLYRISGKSPHQYDEIVDRIVQLRTRPEKPLFVRAAGIYNYWVEKYNDETFLPESDLRCVILLTWLLTDPDAHNINTGLCELALVRWSAEPEPQGRSYSKDIWLCSENIEKFLEMAAVAWKNVILLKQDLNNKNGIFKKSPKNLNIRVADIIIKQPQLTSEQIAKLTDTTAGSVRTTAAWKHRKQLQRRYSAKNGYKTDEGDIEVFSDDVKAEHFDIYEIFQEYKSKKGGGYPSISFIAQKLGISEKQARELLRQARSLLDFSADHMD